jgi:two-component system CheB/CheR fusion protein
MQTLLIVDDDDLVRDALALVMEANGFDVAVAASTAEAIQWVVQGGRPDMVLADYRLRGSDTGVRTVQAVREALRAMVPAIILTGDTSPERLRDINRSGLTVLHKPVLGSTLMAGISSALRGLRSPHGLQPRPLNRELWA